MTFDQFIREEARISKDTNYENGDIVLLYVYVDDVLIASTSPKLAEELSTTLE